MNSENDILSHQARRPKIHILTLDPVLGEDIYERIHNHPRTRFYQITMPKEQDWKQRAGEIASMAQETTGSRVLIIDVRRIFLPRLQQVYNKVVGYNRRDLNRLCYTLLVCDGPLGLFGEGKGIDVFVPHLASLRVDYHPAATFYDPFIHYEPDEADPSMDEEFELPQHVPRRLEPYFKEPGVTVADLRSFFRAAGQGEEVRRQRLRMLAALYLKRIGQQFGDDKERLRGLLSKEGVRLGSEKMHLYPVFFEEWVHDLMQRAAGVSIDD